MQIGKIISHFKGWNLLNTQYPEQLEEIRKTISQIKEEDFLRERFPSRREISLRDFEHGFLEALKQKEWDGDVVIRYGQDKVQHIDGAKGNVGISLALGKRDFLISDLFVKFPLIVKTGQISLVVVLLFMKSVRRPLRCVSFEDIEEILTGLSPLPLQYPFVVLGLGQPEEGEQIRELTTDVDLYLEKRLGYSLDELLILKEQENFEFKRQLPGGRDISYEIGAFANTPGGGLILIGVEDSGEVVGVELSRADEMKLRIINSIRDLCDPCPEVEFQLFRLSGSREKAILILDVAELREKPCTVSGKVYLRVDSSARMAKSQEIRNMILR
jgi:hypothetical protein